MRPALGRGHRQRGQEPEWKDCTMPASRGPTRSPENQCHPGMPSPGGLAPACHLPGTQSCSQTHLPRHPRRSCAARKAKISPRRREDLQGGPRDANLGRGLSKTKSTGWVGTLPSVAPSQYRAEGVLAPRQVRDPPHPGAGRHQGPRPRAQIHLTRWWPPTQHGHLRGRRYKALCSEHPNQSPSQWGRRGTPGKSQMASRGQKPTDREAM